MSRNVETYIQLVDGFEFPVQVFKLRPLFGENLLYASLWRGHNNINHLWLSDDASLCGYN